jgi:hypothetical protein
MLDHVPRDVLLSILTKLDTASLLIVATTCRALRDAANDVRSLRPHVTLKNRDAFLRWIVSRQNAPRVTVLRVSRAISPPPLHTLDWLGTLENLRSFISAFCRVPSTLFQALPTTALLNLHIHQLSPGTNDVFSTRLVSKFTKLRRLHISFAPGWTLAIVGPGLDALTHLETFELRRVPAVAIIDPIPATSHVALHAFDVMSSQIPVAPYATSLRLECDDAPIATLEEMLGVRSTKLSSLVIGSTGMLRVPYLYDMIHLKHLHIWTTIYCFPDLDRLPCLQKLRIDVDSSLVFDQTSSLPPSIHSVNVTAQGTPIDVYEYLS